VIPSALAYMMWGVVAHW